MTGLFISICRDKKRLVLHNKGEAAFACLFSVDIHELPNGLLPQCLRLQEESMEKNSWDWTQGKSDLSTFKKNI